MEVYLLFCVYLLSLGQWHEPGAQEGSWCGAMGNSGHKSKGTALPAAHSCSHPALQLVAAIMLVCCRDVLKAVIKIASQFFQKPFTLSISRKAGFWWEAGQLSPASSPHPCLPFSFILLCLIGCRSWSWWCLWAELLLRPVRNVLTGKKQGFLQPLAHCQLWESCLTGRADQTVLMHQKISEFCSTKGLNVSLVNY